MNRSQAERNARVGTRSRTRRLTPNSRGAVPLRIAPLVIIALILLVMAMLAATTL